MVYSENIAPAVAGAVKLLISIWSMLTGGEMNAEELKYVLNRIEAEFEGNVSVTLGVEKSVVKVENTKYDIETGGKKGLEKSDVITLLRFIAGKVYGVNNEKTGQEIAQFVGSAANDFTEINKLWIGFGKEKINVKLFDKRCAITAEGDVRYEGGNNAVEIVVKAQVPVIRRLDGSMQNNPKYYVKKHSPLKKIVEALKEYNMTGASVYSAGTDNVRAVVELKYLV